jgi:proteasome lid subunit RPN8/RPN11
MHEEVCGVLVGSLCWDGGPYLLVDARIEGKHASHQSGSVTFTSDTWDYIHEELAAKHPDRKIVGWYHTHPGFGIFLSNMDAFIHENFFSFPWQPAYVFDPQAETDGFFFRTDGELRQEDVCIAPDEKPVLGKPMLPPIGSGDRMVIEDERPRKWIWPVVALSAAMVLCLGALVFTLFGRLRDKEEAGRVAETQIETLRHEAVEREEQIRDHRRNEREWLVRQTSYERVIDGLRVQITEITVENRRLESLNETNRAERARLEEERSRQDAVIAGFQQERESWEQSRTEWETERAAERAAERAHTRTLEARIEELERPEVPAPEPPAEESHWYDFLKFWKWF